MKKISTLFKVLYAGKGSAGVITEEVRPENTWVFSESDSMQATQKFDGTATLIKDGKLFKRYDAKPTKEAFKKHEEGTSWKLEDFKQVPEEAIPCQEPDLVTGHYPHWIPCLRDNKEDRYFWEAFDSKESWQDGTYELCGEKVGVNAENLVGHQLIKHGSVILEIPELSFEGLKKYLSEASNNLEGIVFHHVDGRMCKLRKSDFNIKR